MIRAEFIQREVLVLSNRIEPRTDGCFSTEPMTPATRIRLATELADALEKSGEAPWDPPPRISQTDECQEVAAFLRFLGLDSVAIRIKAGEHHTAYREVPV